MRFFVSYKWALKHFFVGFFVFVGVACGYTSPLQGIGRYARTIHQQGCANVACAKDQLFGAAVDAARNADATVLVVGLDQTVEAEFRDRAGLLLPGRQQELVSKVAAASKGPTILVLMSGGPIDVAFAHNDPRISAIVWAGYPGQAGGAAIADILFGTSNPGLLLSLQNRPFLLGLIIYTGYSKLNLLN
jgi:hypothetical protein